MNYPLDYQLRALISFFEDQHKLGIELNNIDGKKPITGIKHLVANVESETVSYTHLDVYKRQERRRKDGAGRKFRR